MQSEVRHFKLGLFFVCALAILIALVGTLGLVDYLGPSFTVETYIYESVEGLDVGSPVKLRGVPMGRVIEIDFASGIYSESAMEDALQAGNLAALRELSGQGGTIVVRMEITELDPSRVLFRQRDEVWPLLVEMGFRARLSQSGLAGPTYIDLEFLDPELYPVDEITWTPEYLYVPSAPHPIAELRRAGMELLTALRTAEIVPTLRSLEAGILTLREWTKDVDMDTVKADLGSLSRDIQASSRRARELLHDERINTFLTDSSVTVSQARALLENQNERLASLIEGLPKTLARIDSLAIRAEEVLDDKRLDKTLEVMTKAATGAEGTIVNAEETLKELRRLARELAQLSIILNDELSVITTNLRRITEDGIAITGDMRENPSRLLLGDPPKKTAPGAKNQQENR